MNKVMNAKRANWVKSMVIALIKEELANPTTVGAIAVDRQVSVLYLDTENPKIGVAKCNPSDTFDLETGLAIAYARANGRFIPDYVLYDGTHFNAVGVGTRFTHKGKTYIKIDDKNALCYDDYKTYTSDGTEYVEIITD